MKTIELTQGFKALVDDEDYEWLNQWEWCAKHSGLTVYAHRAFRRNGKVSTITMHRALMNPDPSVEIDHKDGNGLNNQRSTNLRIATKTQNQGNRKLSRANTTGVAGVYWTKSRNRWAAVIQRKTIGLFKTFEAACVARKLAEKAVYGEFAPERSP